MIWIINISFFLILTCLTGSISMAVWLAAASILQKRGSARMIYRLLKLVMWGYTMPLVYLMFFGWNRLMTSEGWVLVTTPTVKLVLRICFILWIIGVTVYVAFQIPLIYGFRCVRKSHLYARVDMTAVMDRLKQEMGIRKNIVLYQGYAVISPFICGFRRTEIYFPPTNLKERELEIVLRHELTHHKQKDTFWKPAFAIVNGIFWFNPLVWYVSRKMQRWAEASCDEACCQNDLTAREYFGTIMDLVTTETWRPGAYSPLWAEGDDELRWRVDCIDRSPRDTSSKSWIAITAAAIMLVGSCVSVFATTLGASGLYNELYRRTQENEDEILLTDELTEYTGIADELFDGLILEEILEAKSNGINITIDHRIVKYTRPFGRKNGNVINIAGVVEPENSTIQVGIIDSENHLRYINVKNAFSHTFKISLSETYKLYIANTNGATVTVTGGFN